MYEKNFIGLHMRIDSGRRSPFVVFYDEDYLQRIAQGRDPVQEKICQLNVIRAGVPPEEAPLQPNC